MIGRVTVEGQIQGKDSDGKPSVIRVGTDRWAGEWALKAGDSLEEVLRRIVADLRAHRIDASLENANTIKIVLDESKDGSAVDAGYTDNGLRMKSSVGNAPTR